MDFDFFLAFAIFRRILTMTISLEQRPEVLGRRPGAQTLIRLQGHHLQALYKLWVAMSNVRVEHIEDVIENLGGDGAVRG
ncbi:MAG: hypothetical protein DDT20_01161 [Firmicutes bacterium]|nr:hypothetical protein [Bacillota bacterium]